MVKLKLRKILQFALKHLAGAIINKYKPTVIGITGSAGKSSTKEAVYAIFKNKNSRANRGNFNNEIGFPLTIIGDYAKVGGFLFWLKVLWFGLVQVLFRRSYPEFLILEYGADKPKDIDYLLDIAKPRVSVITAMGKVPVHVEFYHDPAEVIKEKAKLISVLSPEDSVVLNIDDQDVFSMAELTKAKIFTFGFDEKANMRISGFDNHLEKGRPAGVAFNLNFREEVFPVRIDGVFGRAAAYASAAAAAVGLSLGLDFGSVCDALSDYQPLAGRLRLIAGIKETWLIDDSYNSSPLSMEEALNTLQKVPAKRKIAALGDMAELGQYTIASHEEAGRQARKSCDFLVTVGAKAKFIAEGAKMNNFPADRILSFDSSEEAGLEIQKMIRPGDLILIKGSQAVRMEKIVLELMAEPKKAGELLVRQYGKWLR